MLGSFRTNKKSEYTFNKRIKSKSKQLYKFKHYIDVFHKCNYKFNKYVYVYYKVYGEHMTIKKHGRTLKLRR